MLTSTCCGLAAARQVKGVPQAPQKWRNALAEERYAVGFPADTSKAASGTVSHAMTGAPCARWHIRQ